MQKKIKYYLMIVFTVVYFESIAQEIGKEIDPYKFSKDISLENQMGAFESSCIGEYKKALEIWDKTETKSNELTEVERKNFLKYHPQNAIKYISQRAKDEKIIIINEAHHQPYHRVFTTELLQSLYQQGFKYFCIEALSYEDPLLNSRKYPVNYSGSYIQEPCYGNLIREALQIGFQLVAYEDSSNSGFDALGNNLREVNQAKNIKRILDKDSSAKILIHCGFGHIKEGKLSSWGKAMAGRLTEYTGINPLTIDQVKMTEHSNPLYEDSYFKSLHLDYDAILLDSASGKTFNGPDDFTQFDIRVYHPRTHFIHGRPFWVFKNGRIPFYVKIYNLSYPCLVYAYLESEKFDNTKPYENPIPYDIIELLNSDEQKALSLKKGKYNIIIKDYKGSVQKMNLTM